MVHAGIQVSRSSISDEEEPVMNVTANGEEPENGNGSGPLSWLGRVPSNTPYLEEPDVQGLPSFDSWSWRRTL